jgi:hypothetical protein
MKGKNPHAAALAKLGAKKAAKARMEKISPEDRREIARHAAQARWNKARQASKAQAAKKARTKTET